MKKEMMDFLNKNRMTVLSVQLLNGYPHGSAMHFAFDEKSFSFIFMTNPNCEKYENIKEKGSALASVVVGFSEDEMKTAQFDGVIEITEDQELINVYFKNFQEKKEGHKDAIFLVFKPEKWKYSDWTKTDGENILRSI